MISQYIKSLENRKGVLSAQKQLLILGLVSIVVLVTLTAYVWVLRAQAVIDRSDKQFAEALANALARGGAEALGNKGSLEGLKFYILEELGKTPAIVYVAFCDKQGKVLLANQSPAQEDTTDNKIFKIYNEDPQNYSVPGVYTSPKGYRSVTNIAVPMKRNKEELGICWVGLDNNAFTILGTPKETNYFLLSVFGLVGLLGMLALWANYSFINRPLRNLAKGASEIALGRFGYQIKYQYAGEEIDSVVNAFNYMSSRLQEYDKQNVDTLMSERNKFISERNKLELVLMSIADGVVVLDRDNKVQIVNAAASELFDKEAKEMLGHPLVFCNEEENSPSICKSIQNFTDSVNPAYDPINQTLVLHNKTIRLNSAPILLGKEFLGAVMIMHDITQQAELERMKNEFISNVSHELRTPITSIKSYVDTLCNHGEKLDSEIYREFLQTIDDEADRLMFLVNDVLELSKIEEGAREFEVQPLDLKLAIERAIRAVNIMAQDRSINLNLNDIQNLPLVTMNQESIERVVINLLTNAIKYTPTGGNINVEAQYETDNNEVRVSVIDSGIGIPEECLEHIFDRFYRVEKKVHTVKGTGLGLTIVKRIIEKHQGRITVESAMGEGSKFSFWLKVANLNNIEAVDNQKENNDLDLLESRAT